MEVEVVVAEVGEHGHGEAGRRAPGPSPARATTPPWRRPGARRRARRPGGPAARAPRAWCAGPVRVPEHRRRPAVRLEDRVPRRWVVVVLPLVPVTPTTVRRLGRVAPERGGDRAQRVAHRRAPQLRQRASQRCARRGGPRRRPRAASRRGRARRRVAPGTQQNSAPGVDGARVVDHGGDLDVAGAPAGSRITRPRRLGEQGVEPHGSAAVVERRGGRGAGDRASWWWSWPGWPAPARARAPRRSPAASASAAAVSGAGACSTSGGGMRKRRRPYWARSANTGAATVPP